MALIGVQTNGLTQLYGVDGAYRVMKAAGFGAADVSLNALLPYRDIVDKKKSDAFEESLAAFREYAEAAEKHGIVNAQAHAPYPSYVAGHGEYNDYLIRVMEISLAACRTIACPRLVIHPFFNGYENAMPAREEWDLNLAQYTRLIPAAKKYGVMILLENMFTRHNGKIYEAICSDFDLACRYIDVLNDRAGERLFGFCLDTGHALLLGKDIRKSMATLGHRIAAFHIHDNNGIDDQHLAPYMGIGDWNGFVAGLKEIGYHGHLSFETYRTITKAFDPALTEKVLALIAETGKLFAERAGV